MIQSYKPASYGTHIKALVMLGVPIIVGQIGTILQGLADTVMTGHYSANSLAAAGFVNNVMVLVLVFSLGFSYGLTPIVGSLHAREEDNSVGHALKCSLQVNGILAILLVGIMGILYFFLDKMGQPKELLPEIRPYYLTILASLPFQMLFNAFKQFSDGIGNTRTPMWIMLSANLLNVIGNWLLIYGVGPFPEWGLLGAGVSTLISRILMLAVFMLLFFGTPYFKKYREGFAFADKGRKMLKELFRMGWPIGLQMGMETASFALSAVMQGWLSISAIAAHQVMVNVGSMCFMVYYGIGAAVAIRISHFKGVNDWSNARRCSYAGFRVIMVTGLLITSSILSMSDHLCALFTNDAGVNQIVISLLLPFILYQFGDGLQTNFANSLRGIGDVKPMMRYAFICYIVISLPLSYFFGFTCGWESVGIWMAFPIALTTAGLLFFRRFYKQTQMHLVNTK